MVVCFCLPVSPCFSSQLRFSPILFSMACESEPDPEAALELDYEADTAVCDEAAAAAEATGAALCPPPQGAATTSSPDYSDLVTAITGLSAAFALATGQLHLILTALAAAVADATRALQAQPLDQPSADTAVTTPAAATANPDGLSASMQARLGGPVLEETGTSAAAGAPPAAAAVATPPAPKRKRGKFGGSPRAKADAPAVAAWAAVTAAAAQEVQAAAAAAAAQQREAAVAAQEVRVAAIAAVARRQREAAAAAQAKAAAAVAAELQRQERLRQHYANMEALRRDQDRARNNTHAALVRARELEIEAVALQLPRQGPSHR